MRTITLAELKVELDEMVARAEKRASDSCPAPCSADSLANKIALEILTTHDGKGICHRIKKLSGQYPDNEYDEGGLCLSALEALIKKHLVAAGYPPNDPSSATGATK